MEMMVRSHVRMEPSKLLGIGVQILEGFLEAGVKGMAGQFGPGGWGGSGCGEGGQEGHAFLKSLPQERARLAWETRRTPTGAHEATTGNP